jgi:hypothetical protein
MEPEKRIRAFVKLGNALRAVFSEEEVSFSPTETATIEFLRKEADEAAFYNGWFTKGFVYSALLALGESMREEKLRKWLAAYDFATEKTFQPKTVGVIMAGNLPAVGFHDFLSVLVSGHRILARLSSDDNKLLPAVAEVLMAIEPEFSKYISFTEGQMKGFDAVIATGSNNTSRYFEYYFGKYPNIIRKNRNGVAVLTGDETEEQLKAIAADVFLYYGMGCRNVAKLFVPQDYDFIPLLKGFEAWHQVNENHKYFNNYEYNKAIFLVNGRHHFDTGNMLVVEEENFASPVSVLHYEYYSDHEVLRNQLLVNHERIQCVISEADFLSDLVPMGKSQSPELWDYADGVDTMAFLLGL